VLQRDESEPGTFKDRELMQKSPHMLIEGMIIAAYAAGINRAFIYIRGEYALQADILDEAVKEAEAAGFLGKGILGTDLDLSLVVHRGAGAYICGEETALLDSLEGKRGNPRLKPPFPANQGLYQGPTLINNVETLATCRTSSRWAATSTPRSARELDGHEARVGLGQRQAARATTRSRSACRCARSSTTSAAASRRPRGEVLLPRRLLLARADQGRPRPPLRLRLDGQGGLHARLGRDHRRRRPDLGRRRLPQARAVLQARVVRQVHPRAARGRSGR
jgi:hypothetical protein